jgi:prepilin-type N-terminal cleavage/methylation domain-containing protein
MSAFSPVLTNRTTSRTGSRPVVRDGDRPASAGVAAPRGPDNAVDPTGPRRPVHAVTDPTGPPVCVRTRTGRRRPGRPVGQARGAAFTLIELMIVMMIIVILAALLIPALWKAKENARRKQAQKEVSDIAGAVTSYFIDRSEYPPDTFDWEDWQGEEDEVDPRSIHRFLGMTVEGRKGRTYGPYMSIGFKRLTDVQETEGQKVGIYTDPWGSPYHLDAVHTLMIEETPTRVGAPYRSGTTVPSAERTLDFKVASCGPDKETTPYYIFDPDVSDPVVKKIAEDDVRSW